MSEQRNDHDHDDDGARTLLAFGCVMFLGMAGIGLMLSLPIFAIGWVATHVG